VRRLQVRGLRADVVNDAFVAVLAPAGAYLHLRKSSSAGGGHIPVAHRAAPASVQKAPGGARHTVPMHGVPRGQSAGLEHVAHIPPGHA
jgi:hypothetical protein